MPFWQGQPDLAGWEWLLRAAVMYPYLLLLTKLMGQRVVGRLSLFDFVIAVSVGSILGGVLSSSTVNMTGPVITLAALAGFHVLISIISLKNSKARRVLEDEPIIIIQNGQFLENAMKKARFNVDDILAQLREKGYFYPHQVEFAVLEHDGKVSVLPKSQNRPISPADLNLPTKYEGYPTVVVEDGNVVEDNLHRIQLSPEWLKDRLVERGIESADEVLLAVIDTQGRLYYSLKNQASEQLMVDKVH